MWSLYRAQKRRKSPQQIDMATKQSYKEVKLNKIMKNLQELKIMTKDMFIKRNYN